MSTVYYKALRTGRYATHAPEFRWPEPGVWLEVDGPLVPCVNGLHVGTATQIVGWLSDELWVVEVDDSAGMVDAGDKTVVARARLVTQTRWDESVARLFAADCAERVLHLFESECPDDDRPRRAIAAARAYAHGDIDDAAQDAAAWDAWVAARAAAQDAAAHAAWAAAQAAAHAAAQAAAWARGAAHAAARAAAQDAAWAAAQDAAWAAAREWQASRLLDYVEVPA